MQELQAQVTARSDELTRTLQRAPTVRELAASLDVTEDDILDAHRGTARLRHGLASTTADDDGAVVA